MNRQFNKELFLYEPIISVDTFNKVQTLLKRQGKACGRPRIKEIKTLPNKICEAG